MFHQVVVNVRIVFLFCRKFRSVAPILALWIIAIDSGKNSVVIEPKFTGNESTLAVGRTPGKPFGHFEGWFPGQHSDPIVSLLTMIDNLVTKLFDIVQGEILIGDLGFLKADDVRIMGLYDCFQLMQSNPNAVDVE